MHFEVCYVPYPKRRVLCAMQSQTNKTISWQKVFILKSTRIFTVLCVWVNRVTARNLFIEYLRIEQQKRGHWFCFENFIYISARMFWVIHLNSLACFSDRPKEKTCWFFIFAFISFISMFFDFYQATGVHKPFEWHLATGNGRCVKVENHVKSSLKCLPKLIPLLVQWYINSYMWNEKKMRPATYVLVMAIVTAYNVRRISHLKWFEFV